LGKTIALKVLENGLPEGTLLNINVPALPISEIRGIKITRQGRGRYEEFFEKRIDPMNRTYYWLDGKRLDIDTEEDVDEVAVRNNYVSITPLQYDLTDHKLISQLKNWDIAI
jgi:5'-nucleotidase